MQMSSDRNIRKTGLKCTLRISGKIIGKGDIYANNQPFGDIKILWGTCETDRPIFFPIFIAAIFPVPNRLFSKYFSRPVIGKFVF